MSSASKGLVDNTPSSLKNRWYNRPDLFFQEVLGIWPWDRQYDILHDVTHYDRVAVRSGHKVSKSNTLSGLALWWLSTRERGRVPITSSTYLQVRKIIWHEVKKMRQNARTPLGGRFYEDPQSGYVFEDGREIFGFSTDKPEKAAGISGDQILYLIDEASGEIERTIDAIEGNLAGGGKIVMFGNPTRTSGEFFNAFHTKRQFWKTLHIASTETPNYVHRKKIIPGLATYEWAEERLRMWGADSPIYAVRVGGNFPRQSDMAVVPLWLVEEAQRRYDEHTLGVGPMVIGVDVSYRGSDKSVVQPVKGFKMFKPDEYNLFNDGHQLAGHVQNRIRKLRAEGFISHKDKAIVNVDLIGWGAACYEALKYSDQRNDVGYRVNGINVAEKADDETKYSNMRTQLTFAIADWLKDGGELIDHPILASELVAPEYVFDSRGRHKLRFTKVEEAEAKNLGHSPDNRDALMLAIYNPTLVIETASRGTRFHKSRQMNQFING